MTAAQARARVRTFCLYALVLCALIGPIAALLTPLAPASMARFLPSTQHRPGLKRKGTRSMDQQQTRHYSRSQEFAVSADQVFTFISDVGNLPTYLPPITSTEALPDEQVRLQGEVPHHGKIDGQGYVRVQTARKRMEWGANVGRDYSGSLAVTDTGDGHSALTVELAFGPRSVEPEAQRDAGPGRDPLEEGVSATLESIRRQVEGEGGKVIPPSPPA